MARAAPLTNERQSLHERDFYLWVKEQAGLLRQGAFRAPRTSPIWSRRSRTLGIGAKKAVKSNLVIVLLHLLKHQFQPRATFLEVGSTRAPRAPAAAAARHEAESEPPRSRLETVFPRVYGDARARDDQPRPVLSRGRFLRHLALTPWNRPSTRISCPTEGRMAGVAFRPEPALAGGSVRHLQHRRAYHDRRRRTSEEAGPRAWHTGGLRRGGARRPDRVPARQPDLLVLLAQRVAAPPGAGALPGARSAGARPCARAAATTRSRPGPASGSASSGPRSQRRTRSTPRPSS